MREGLITAAIVATLLTGCTARRHAVGSVAAASEERMSLRREAAETDMIDLAMIDNLTLEHPEIIIIDTVTHRSLTIKGARLTRERSARAESVHECAETTACYSAASEATVSDREVTTEGRTGLRPIWVIITAAIVWLLTGVKKWGDNNK